MNGCHGLEAGRTWYLNPSWMICKVLRIDTVEPNAGVSWVLEARAGLSFAVCPKTSAAAL